MSTPRHEDNCKFYQGHEGECSWAYEPKALGLWLKVGGKINELAGWPNTASSRAPDPMEQLARIEERLVERAIAESQAPQPNGEGNQSE